MICNSHSQWADQSLTKQIGVWNPEHWICHKWSTSNQKCQPFNFIVSVTELTWSWFHYLCVTEREVQYAQERGAGQPASTRERERIKGSERTNDCKLGKNKKQTEEKVRNKEGKKERQTAKERKDTVEWKTRDTRRKGGGGEGTRGGGGRTKESFAGLTNFEQDLPNGQREQSN